MVENKPASKHADWCGGTNLITVLLCPLCNKGDEMNKPAVKKKKQERCKFCNCTKERCYCNE